MTSTLTSDPTEMPSATAQARLGALKSRRVSDTDPRVVECREALAYWRCRRVIDAERGKIAPDHLDELVSQLRGAVAR